MKQLDQLTFESAISQGIVVVDFFAERCGPCKMIAPYLDEMQQRLGDTVTFYKVDVDLQQELAAQQSISAMPTLKIFIDGNIHKTIVGADLQALRRGIQEALQSKSSNNELQMAA